MTTRISKRDLRQLAEELGAEEILGRKSNIYKYEDARYNECKRNGWSYECIAYSAGVYGNTGRIDKLVNYNAKSEKWELVKYIFYTE